MQSKKEYWEKSTPMNFKDEKWSYEQRRRFRFDLQDYMKKVIPFKYFEDKIVLEIGCGGGIDLLEFGRSGAFIHGIDLTDNAIELTLRTADEAGLDVKATVASADKIPYPDNYFDLVYCTPEDSIISGCYKTIKDMNIGDSSIGKEYDNSVLQTFKRHYSGDMYTIKAGGMFPVKLTKGHRVLVSTGEVFHRYKKIATREFSEPYWKNVEDISVDRSEKENEFHIKKRDYLVIPRVKGTISDNTISLRKYIISKRSESLLKYFGRALSIELDDEFAWFCGMYVAEGSSHKGGINFSLHINETDVADRLISLGEKLGYKVILVYYPESNGVQVRLLGTLISRAFADFFGKGASNKKIPDFILYHKNCSYLTSFLNGYEQGDGCNTNGVMSIGTVSKLLAMQLQIAYARLGKFAKVYECSMKNRVPSMVRYREIRITRDYWYNVIVNGDDKKLCRAYVTNDNIYSQISTTECSKFDGDVYNIQTQDNTYLISNATVHNCFGVLHHIPEVDKALDEIHRVLKTGGKIIAMVYNKDSLLYAYSIIHLHRDWDLTQQQENFLSANYSERNEGCPYTQCYTREEAINLFSRNFKEVSVSTHYNVVDTPEQRKVKLGGDLDKFGFGWHHIVKGEK